MQKPEEEDEGQEDEADPEEEQPELPNYPFVVVATHADLKKDKKVKNIVDSEAGADMASGAGAVFCEVNANGKNVKKALEAVISAIRKVEDNLVFDKEPTRWEKCCKCCKACCKCACCTVM